MEAEDEADKEDEAAAVDGSTGAEEDDEVDEVTVKLVDVEDDTGSDDTNDTGLSAGKGTTVGEALKESLRVDSDKDDVGAASPAEEEIKDALEEEPAPVDDAVVCGATAGAARSQLCKRTGSNPNSRRLPASAAAGCAGTGLPQRS